MSIFSGLVVYLILFWTVLFAVLPWGNRAEEVPKDGQWGGAPINPRIRKKFLVTAIVSAILWVIVFLLIYLDVIDFFEIARHMSEEDKGL